MLVRKRTLRWTIPPLMILLVFQAFAVEQPIVTSPDTDWESSYLRLQNGVQVVAFARGTIGSQDVYMTIKTGSNWGTPFRIDLGGIGAAADDTFPDLAELSGSRVMVAWSQCPHPPLPTTCNIVYNIYSFTQGWNSCFGESCFTTVVDDGYSNTGPSLLVKPSGEICVFYHTTTPGNTDIYNVCFGEEGTIPPPTKMPLSSPTLPDYFASAVLNKGLVWLAWEVNNHDIYLTNNDLSLDMANWAAPVLLVTSLAEERRPSLAVTGDEGLWLLWETTRDSNLDPETNIYYKRSLDPMNIDSWLPDTLLVGSLETDASPSAVDVEPGVLGVIFSSNRDGTYDLYYTTIIRKTGDTDWDGDVDLDDLIGTYLAQFSTTPTNLYRYDIDRDGNIDLDDLITVFLNQFT